MKNKKQYSKVSGLSLALARLDSVDVGHGKHSYQRTDGHWYVLTEDGSAHLSEVQDKPTIAKLETAVVLATGSEHKSPAPITTGGVKSTGVIAEYGKPGEHVGIKPNEPTNKTAEVIAKEEIGFKAIAHEIINLTLTASEKYRDLCLYIRDNQLDKKTVTKWMLDCGFSKTRAAEVNKVCQLPPEQFNEFACRVIGFKNAIALSRKNFADMKKANVIGVKNIKTEMEVTQLLADAEKELAKIEAQAAAETKKTAEATAGMTEEQRIAAVMETKRAAALASAESHALSLLKAAGRYCDSEDKVRTPLKRVWNCGNGYVLSIKTAKKFEAEKETE